MTPPTPGRRSYAMLLVLMIVLLLSAAGFMVAAQMQSRMASTLDEARNVHLRNLVDSGVALGLARIAEDRYWSGTFSQDFDGGAVECTLNVLPQSRRSLRVQATYGGESWEYLAEIFVPPTGLPSVQDLRRVPGFGGDA